MPSDYMRGMLCGLVLAGALASAQETGGPGGALVSTQETGRPRDLGRFQAGVNVGLIGLPRPLTIEGYARVHPYLGITAGWSYFPKSLSDPLLNAVGAQSATTKATLDNFSAWEVALRVYPMRGTFFIGLGAGLQNIDGTVAEKQGDFTGVGTVSVQTWFLTPRVGWQWVWGSGFALGFDIGVQFTVSHQDTLILPPGTPPDVARDAQKYVEFGATLPLPSFNLRLGYHFG
jgi:hypothetical protein